uniref:Folate/biopterin transporter n=1 Tax=Aureoumbra lagunensis TaxID=44058 RepID=A0A7S3JW41_9STRA|mmetsp:Transcript_21398/g.32821  ORF Transcript_21398/g.32821 Transcript_21398/m.32821 type:complete len:721 (-) Transcript_21398:384-2546(-)
MTSRNISSPAQFASAFRRAALATGIFSPAPIGSTPESTPRSSTRTPILQNITTQSGSKYEGKPLLSKQQRSMSGSDLSADYDATAAAWREKNIQERYKKAQKSAAHKIAIAKRRQRESRFGLLAQYFFIGIIYGGLPQTLYGLYLGYLNVPGYIYATASTLIAWPWSLKFLFGAINDCCPLWGYRRKSYMVLGWSLCCAALCLLALRPLPEPYWCYEYDDKQNPIGYITTIPGTFLLHNGTRFYHDDDQPRAAEPCNPSAPESAGILTMLMTIAGLGYCVSDCAADGLTVTLAKREPKKMRGKTQTTVYLVRSLGNIAAVFLIGVGMNSWKYYGSFRFGLSFNQICFIFALCSAIMIPISWYMVIEPRLDDDDDDDDEEDHLSREEDHSLARSSPVPRRGSPGGLPPLHPKTVISASPYHLRDKKKGAIQATPNLRARITRRVTLQEYTASVWTLLRSRAFLSVILYQLLTPMIGSIYTTAAGEVKQHWAKVKVAQNSVFSVIGLGLFAYGLHLVKKYFLSTSWRVMTLLTTILLNLIDMPFTFLTIYDYIRNQYFFLGEILVATIPAAANFVISTFVVVEMSQAGSEGIVYGLLTTYNNLGAPVAQAISIQLFGTFKPSLSDPKNYLNDSTAFRNTVALSFVVSYAFAFTSLLTLPLLPDQKDDAQRRKRTAPSKDLYAWVALIILGIGLLYSFTINVLAVIPKTSCLRIAGGAGCDPY